MKKIIIAALVVIAGSLASCQKEHHEATLKAPLHTFMGFKNDISTAD
ncbi:hypothetical protein IM792_17695 [Mucilaginibacter sp. JRF]|nr:hypothetical protein [Mucilaginibacter sp. JRF]MBE9586290.1 hypothetical protein [Mucilaginibacter sp. JRF]